ncbi:hypothetical protein [Streptantibioticus silvisoli]|uniref:Uncharacterized protein n=1 Tax=Streptantibioticus silvisoli TaxID=2705255 RepID=A0ABT6VSS9_9ACTN|nr:hypothetical protein [Streptantibioticus silvisoli]MDI5961535.1 hypothetical protein [Streptantibioticus silvisoli]
MTTGRTSAGAAPATRHHALLRGEAGATATATAPTRDGRIGDVSVRATEIDEEHLRIAAASATTASATVVPVTRNAVTTAARALAALATAAQFPLLPAASAAPDTHSDHGEPVVQERHGARGDSAGSTTTAATTDIVTFMAAATSAAATADQRDLERLHAIRQLELEVARLVKNPAVGFGSLRRIGTQSGDQQGCGNDRTHAPQ